MVKEPRLGRVKTRLAADIGKVRATWWFRHQSASLIRRMARDSRWETHLAVAPDHAGLTSRIWPDHIPRIPQGTGDLGDRMRRIFNGFAPDPTLIIGADIPGVTPTHIAAGFHALRVNETVFGPALDGGYWAIGWRGKMPLAQHLAHVRWSSENALADSIASLGNRSITYLDRLEDIDTGADLAAFKRG